MCQRHRNALIVLHKDHSTAFEAMWFDQPSAPFSSAHAVQALSGLAPALGSGFQLVVERRGFGFDID